jgi:DNA-binding LytR/AlgR family response regulator
MKVLVVDDEAPARRRLLRMLAAISDVEVVGEAADGLEARAMIDAHAPDLVLLDIHMPELDGLALARDPGMPAVVFTTAHAEHAVVAFELAAVDYLLKPIERERLERAIERARARVEGRLGGEQLDQVLRAAKLGEPPRLAAKSGTRVHLLPVVELTCLVAQDKYVATWHEGREHLLDDSLAVLEPRLAPFGFVRVHRAALVNLAAVTSIVGDAGSARVELKDGRSAPVSRRELSALRRRLGLA